MTNINNYMTVSEASHRWDISPNTLRSRLRSDRHDDLNNFIDKGMIKYFKPDGKVRGEWIISSSFMELLYGKEKNF